MAYNSKLLIGNGKPFYTNTEMYLRLGIFLAHAVSSVVMLMKAFGVFDESGCKPIIQPALNMVPSDSAYVRELNPLKYMLPMNRYNNVTDCSSDLSWNQGWCKFKNLPQLYDYESDHDSFVFASSWNIIFAITVFEWITASYALLYFDPFDSWLSYEPLYWGLHPIPVLCTVWNLFLIIFMWAYRASMAVPYNNAFLYTMALSVTIVIQNYLAINRSYRIDDEKQDPYVDTKKDVELRTDLFLRNNKRAAYKPLVNAMGADFHQPNYMILYDKCSCSPIPRYLEYMLTAPLLLVALYASSVPNDLVWKFQFVIVALLSCNAIGIPLHYSVLNVSIEPWRYAMAGGYLLTASWICLVSGVYLFVWTIRDFLMKNDSGMPQWVQILIWMLIVLYAMFGILASRYYVPRLVYGTHYDHEDYRWLSFYFDICSLLIKVPIAWTIWVKGAILSCEHSVTC
jgi:hypothetical protein